MLPVRPQTQIQGIKSRTLVNFPPDVEGVFREFRTCEFTTLAKNSVPVTWPVAFFWRPERGCFLISVSIGLPQKVFNIRRNPKVSLLFSNPTGSDLINPPAVLVQGDAKVSDRVFTAFKKLEESVLSPLIRARQPKGAMISSNWVMRYLMDWYYMRLEIWITPQRILWWDHGDFRREPHEVVISNVG
jgi:hypothetical protein